MQFERSADGALTTLPKPSVDTGMGLERLAAVMQGVHSNYEIDLFVHLIEAAAALTRTSDLGDKSLRVIADHIRACSFLIADGVVPGNEGRGYVLRRIIRRAIRHGYKLGVEEPFFYKLVKDVEKEMGGAYPDPRQAAQRMSRRCCAKRSSASRRRCRKACGCSTTRSASSRSGGTLPGETVFKLYDTYGFPEDLTADIGRERGLPSRPRGLRARDGRATRARSQGEPIHDGRGRQAVVRPRDGVPRLRDARGRGAGRRAARRGRQGGGCAEARPGRHRRARAHTVLRRERRPDRRHAARSKAAARASRSRTRRSSGSRSATSARSSRARSRSATQLEAHVDAQRRAAIVREPLGDAPVACRAAQSARRARAAEGLARRSRPPTLRLLALRARDARSSCARSSRSSTSRSAGTPTQMSA